MREHQTPILSFCGNVRAELGPLDRAGALIAVLALSKALVVPQSEVLTLRRVEFPQALNL